MNRKKCIVDLLRDEAYHYLHIFSQNMGTKVDLNIVESVVTDKLSKRSVNE